MLRSVRCSVSLKFFGRRLNIRVGKIVGTVVILIKSKIVR